MGIAAIAGEIAGSLLGLHPPVKLGPWFQEIVIDVLETESPEYSMEISEDPVECGTDITDHTFEKPATLTLDCILTDLELTANSLKQNLASGAPILTTWREKKDALYAMKDGKQLVNITTPLGFYQNYLIESISPSVSIATGDCFRFRIVLRNVNIVSSAIGYIDPLLMPVDLQSAATDAAKKTKPKEPGGPAESGSSAQTSSGGSTADAYAF